MEFLLFPMYVLPKSVPSYVYEVFILYALVARFFQELLTSIRSTFP